MGAYAGCSPGGITPQSTGIANIGIGLSVQMPDRFGSNQLAIGQTSKYWIVGDQNFNVGIGTTIPTNPVTSGNTQKLAVGILTAHQVFGSVCSSSDRSIDICDIISSFSLLLARRPVPSSRARRCMPARRGPAIVFRPTSTAPPRTPW